MAKISIENVHKDYGDFTALHPFSLEIQDGEFVVLVGPSGCGKSTMLKILAGLEPATGGQIRLDDRDVTDLAPGDRDIAMVFQNYALYPHLTVRQNIGFGLKMRKVSSNQIARKVEEAAKTLGVSHLLDRKPKALSGGQRQRVALGRAIVREPQAFLMDEPLSNLDAKLRVHMRAEISALHNRIGVTTVYVTHDQIEAMTMADRVVLMRDGVIQQIADPDTLFQKPVNLFAAGFIGSPGMNLLSASFDGALIKIFGKEVPVSGHENAQTGKVIAGLRPEHLELGDGPVTFRVRSSLVESLGSEKYVYFHDDAHHIAPSGDAEEENDKGLIARVSHTGHLAENEDLTLSFDPANLYLFDAETEKAL